MEDKHQDLLVNFGDSPSQVRKDTSDFLRREIDSMDDFEHLETDTNNQQENKMDAKFDELLSFAGQNEPINTNNDFVFGKDPNPLSNPSKDTNLFDLPSETPPKSLVDDFLGAPIQSEPPLKSDDKAFGDFIPQPQPTSQKSDIDNFLQQESHQTISFSPAKTPDIPEKYSDSEPEPDDEPKSSIENFLATEKSEKFEKSETPTFKDTIEPDEDIQIPELPVKDYPISVPSGESVFEKSETILPEPVRNVPKFEPEPEPVFSSRFNDTPVIKEPEILEPEPPKPKMVETKVESKIEKKQQPKKEAMGAELMFCQMGLDAWFNPERLNPKVESLIYWRDPKKSGIVFGGTLIILLSLSYFSLISVFAYLSLISLVGTISFRIYKNVLQAVQKTSDGHPFKDFLEADIQLPQDKVRELSEIVVTHLNAAALELRRLFLVEDLVDSIKFGVTLWVMTYVGAWFNGMTLLIIAFVALFTLPKVYENNKTQIDANLDIVRTKVAEITSKVKAAIPIGKKSEEKKEQ